MNSRIIYRTNIFLLSFIPSPSNVPNYFFLFLLLRSLEHSRRKYKNIKRGRFWRRKWLMKWWNIPTSVHYPHCTAHRPIHVCARAHITFTTINIYSLHPSSDTHTQSLPAPHTFTYMYRPLVSPAYVTFTYMYRPPRQPRQCKSDIPIPGTKRSLQIYAERLLQSYTHTPEIITSTHPHA